MNNSSDGAFMPESIAAKIDQLCKPPGSLGRIEAIAHHLCRIQRTLTPVTFPRHVCIFAADHGVVQQGVSAWPSEVTAAVTDVMVQGRTASGIFASTLQCGYEVVDVGLLRACNSPIIHSAKRRSTGDLMIESAMTLEDFEHAWQSGVARAAKAADAGNRVLIGGEMGIGNTTPASCLIALLCNVESDQVVGRGAGVDNAGLDRKRKVVVAAMKRVRQLGSITPQQIAIEVGGLEIVALAGFYREAAQRGITIVLDGLIATSAAVLANAINPDTCEKMIAGHRSTEPGHLAALEQLKLEPVLDMQLRLGEATGALAALPLLDLAAAMMNGMASLSELRFV
ncbi:nicotinate-nucleotide--dimethylbenzimidazole phosphoribosyltransferase [Pirellulaceae bacterium SH501]